MVRFMRAIVFFDLPVLTSMERREYNKFRKFLIKSGYLMLQESVYCKLVLNASAAESLSEQLQKNSPVKGIVQLLIITEKQFSRILYVVGAPTSDVINTDERTIIV
jgi:CRISPR-associated protein Cas2